MFDWYKSSAAVERKTFWACFAGWALDALDVQMLGLIIPALTAVFALTKTEAGLISSLTLVASALGGWIAGSLSDRIGRVRTLQIAILWFSICTFLSGFAQDYTQFIALKTLQGFGFGGEWTAGSVLLSEVIAARNRGRAMSATQSAWSVGWGAAVLLYALAFSWLKPDIAWRAMLIAGLIPGLLVLYVRRHVPEPKRIASAPEAQAKLPLTAIFGPRTLRVTLIGGCVGLGAHGGFIVLSTWLPTFLRTERHLSVLHTSGYLAVLIFAFFCGYVSVGYLLDRFGRRPTIILFAFACTAMVVLYTLLPLTDHQMLAMGFPLGFFAAGIPGSMGALFSELYPSGIRGSGVGFCYNFGRIASAAFPVLVGKLAEGSTLGNAIGITAAVGYGIVALSVLLLPETRGRDLDTVTTAETTPPAELGPTSR
ncbi:MFS transporter [Chitinasiproducens palmae]|uniref:Sugar phosphate permease n=1 Tax=Chitinasiproducens palmae TaxID=1770053 RepID=A0A1H2PKQ2_9BURK|nr:MFS transporter [Chitinasiproducens palmae]SDV47014.1 Sugar phosphate permease [Chitinasiproducens palmae]